MLNKFNKRCQCGKDRVTNCDKCNEPICYKCSTIYVEKPTAVVVKVFHEKCRPKKRKEVKE